MTTIRRRALVLTACIGALVAGCSLLGSDNPRPDDQAGERPPETGDAPVWTSVSWQEATVEIEIGSTYEQTDRASAIAHGEAGFVAVGSNTDVMHYVGRIWHSPDGLDWTAVRLPILDGVEMVDVAGGPGGFVAIGTDAESINDPTAVFLHSGDGRDWTVAERFVGSWSLDIDGSDVGYLASLEVGDESVLVASDTGAGWERVPSEDLPIQGAYLPGVAIDGGERMATGSSDAQAVLLRSSDGNVWSQDTLPGSSPVEGLSAVSAYDLVSSPNGDLLLGLDESTECETDDEWCGRWGAIWASAGEQGWQRLPESNRLMGLGWGVSVWGAGDVGFLAWDVDDLITSRDGWRWDVVPQRDAPDTFVNDAVVVGNRIVVVADDWSDLEGQDPDGPDLDPVWFGVGTIER